MDGLYNETLCKVTFAVQDGNVVSGELAALDADEERGAAAAGHYLARIVARLET